MNAERLEIARRLVACPKWVWLPGMAAVGETGSDFGDRIVNIRIGGTRATAASGCSEVYEINLPFCLPDLDDDLTRMGVLAVVRRAHDDPSMGVVGSRGGLWCVSRSKMAEHAHPLAVDLRWPSMTEETALLAALESAA